MSQEPRQHRLRIERPRGLPGYRPKLWCAVCGRAAATDDKLCEVANCPNICHIQCLADDPVFNCEQTSLLRDVHGIADNVTFHTTHQAQEDNANEESINNSDENNEDEDLQHLEKSELIDIVKNLKKELTNSKTRLNNYKACIDKLPEKRNILVEAISIIDTLVATQTNTEELQQRTIAASAYPSRIDEDWENHIENNDEVYIWWTSETVGRLRKGNDEEEIPQEQPRRRRQSPARAPRTRRTQWTRQQPTQPPPPPPPPSPPPQHTRQSKNKQGYNHSSKQQPRRYRPNNWYGYKQHPRSNDEFQVRRSGSNDEFQVRRSDPSKDNCAECRRPGHSANECRKLMNCNYCHKRYHTAENCREKIADQRQQDLINAVRHSTQETLAAVRLSQNQRDAGQVYHPGHYSGQHSQRSWTQPQVNSGHLQYYTAQQHAAQQAAPPSTVFY